jgi:hypothetical protein
MSVLDFPSRTVRLAGPLRTTGDYKADLAKILAPYATAEGRRTGQFALPDTD